MSDRHWSRAREGTNKEAVDYYRERSHAPGVAEGGGARNMYCMQCDGVIPIAHQPVQPLEVCPHCQAPLEGDVKRYFNWVEIDRAPASDMRALRPLFLSVFVIVVSVVGFVWWLVARGSSA